MHCPTRNARFATGLSLLEVMISLAIVAMLLTAVATAFSASSAVIEANDEFFRASQAARVTLNHITTDLRRGSAIMVLGDRVTLNNEAGANVHYRWDNANRRIMYSPDTAGTAEYVLCTNVAGASCDTDALGKHIALEIIVDVGSNRVRLAGSVTPRQSIDWSN
jgi:prepilin-type N-terminal cleavage/methylation domain-containing protein